MLRDIIGGDDPQVLATLEIIAAVDADILLILDMDYDAEHVAITALNDALQQRGAGYTHHFSAMPNSGRPTGVDLDGDGRSWRARDAHGYGLFSGDGGMVILSRFALGEIRDFTGLLWQELPDTSAAAVTPIAAMETLSLHTVAAWDVEVLTPSGPIHVLASHATPPVFDGPEDRNGLRNADELAFWARYIDGWAPDGPSFAADHFALLGTLNIDPNRGEGRQDGLRSLLDHAALQDPEPVRPAGGMESADWSRNGPGPLRVDYILPSRSVSVTSSGVLWPDDQPIFGVTAETAAAASDHRLIWVDIAF